MERSCDASMVPSTQSPLEAAAMAGDVAFVNMRDGAQLCDITDTLPERPMVRQLQPDKATPPAEVRSFIPDDVCHPTSTSPPSARRTADLVPLDPANIALPPSPPPLSVIRSRDTERAGGSFVSHECPSRQMPSENSSMTSESWCQDSLSLSSARSAPLDVIARDNTLAFPPRMPGSRRYSSTHKRHVAAKGIRSWMTARATDRRAASSTGSREQSSSVSEEGLEAFEQSSESSLDGHEVDTLWTQLVAQRRLVKNSRKSMARSRSQLIDLRLRLSEADNAFMAMIRPVILPGIAQQQSPQRLLQRFTELQELRDAYQGLELDHDETQRRLMKEESRLYHREIKFYDILGDLGDEFDGSDDSFHDAIDTAIPMPLELQGISPEKPLDIHPLYGKLEQAVAEQRYWREEYAVLWEARDHYEDEAFRSLRLKEQKSQLLQQTEDSMIPRKALEFLEDFPATERRLEQKIAESTSEVHHYAHLCQQKGAMLQHPHGHVWAAIHPDLPPLEDIDLGDTDAILSKPRRLAHPAFPELLSQPNHLLKDPYPLTPEEALEDATRLPHLVPERAQKIRAAEKEMFIEALLQNRNEMTSATFVDQWILFTLRISPLDVALLFSIFLKRLSVKNIVRWQHDVLLFWNKDGLSSRMERNQAYMEQSDYLIATLPGSRATTNNPEKPEHRVRRIQSCDAVMGSARWEPP